MLLCGLLGKKLSHSYSPQIHKEFFDYEYRLFEKQEDEIKAFLSKECHNFDGINVTIPYKKTVIEYLDSVSDVAKKTGSVNTIVKKPDGTLYGDNTDVYGFTELVRISKISVENKKVLVLGSGGASAAVLVALNELNAKPVVISRSGENNYDNLYLHKDADVIVNTTPVGMYPKTGESPLDLSLFDKLGGVLDIIYNPSKTELLLQAEKLNIPFANGLYMLVAQAKKSAELFANESVSEEKVTKVYEKLNKQMQNIILIGMPGCGKSTIAKALGEILNRKVADTDTEIEKRVKKTPAELILEYGEKHFRDIECEVVSDLSKESGLIIATGGGVVERKENHKSLHQNGVIVWLKRDVSNLPCDNRPLSQKFSPQELFRKREPLYTDFADITVDIVSDKDASVKSVLSKLDFS